MTREDAIVSLAHQGVDVQALLTAVSGHAFHVFVEDDGFAVELVSRLAVRCDAPSMRRRRGAACRAGGARL